MQIDVLKQLQICVMCVRNALFSLYLDHARGFFALIFFFDWKMGDHNICLSQSFLSLSLDALFPYLGLNLYIVVIFFVLELIVSLFLIFSQIDSHIKRLDEDLTSFAEDLKQGSENSSLVSNTITLLQLILNFTGISDKLPRKTIRGLLEVSLNTITIYPSRVCFRCVHRKISLISNSGFLSRIL